MMRRLLTIFLLLLPVQVFAQAPSRVPLLIAGKQSLYHRVITRPGATLSGQINGHNDIKAAAAGCSAVPCSGFLRTGTGRGLGCDVVQSAAGRRRSYSPAAMWRRDDISPSGCAQWMSCPALGCSMTAR
jgi:hypothetical protein